MSIEKRRSRGDLIQISRILKGFDSVDADHFFRIGCPQRCQLQVRQNFFSVRIVNIWNKLPESVVQSASVNVFSKSLDDWIADVDF